MKKFYFFIMVFVVAVSAHCQVEITQYETQIQDVRNVSEINIPSSKATFDTLGFFEFFLYTAQVYSLRWGAGGYVFGTSADLNGAGLYFNTFAQGYFNICTSNIGFVGALIWVSNVHILSVNGCNIQIKAAKIDGISSYSVGGTPHTIDCPGPVLSTASFNINDVDTAWSQSYGFIAVDFPTTVLINPGEDLAVIFDASNCTLLGDTIGVFASDDGVIDMVYGRDYTWVYYPALSNYVLYDHLLTTGLNKMPAIFAIVDLDYIPVGGVDFFQNMQLTISPNPTSDMLTIAYAINKNMNAKVDIIDAVGRIVHTSDFGFITSGEYVFTVDLTGFAAGQYYVSFATDAGRLTKKLIIQ